MTIIKITDNSIELKGHAENSIVCSAISSICITSINCCLKCDNGSIKFYTNDGYLKIDNLKHDKITNEILGNMIDLLIELQEQFPQNIEVIQC